MQADTKARLPIVKIYRVKETGLKEAKVILEGWNAARAVANWLDGMFTMLFFKDRSIDFDKFAIFKLKLLQDMCLKEAS